MKIRQCGLLALGCLALAARAAAEETIDSVCKRIIEQNQKHRSFSGKLTMVGEMETPMGKMSQTGDGSLEYLRKGDTTLFRVEIKMVTSQPGPQGADTKMEQSQLRVGDGEFVYTVVEMMGQKQAAKEKPEPDAMQFGAKEMIQNLQKDCELKLLPDDTVEGKPSFVFEAVRKDDDPMSPVGKMVLSFAKESGVMLKQVVFSKDGKPLQTMTITDIKMDPSIDPDRFKFKAPEGVEVRDMTTRAAPATAPAQPLPPASAPAPKKP